MMLVLLFVIWVNWGQLISVTQALVNAVKEFWRVALLPSP